MRSSPEVLPAYCSSRPGGIGRRTEVDPWIDLRGRPVTNRRIRRESKLHAAHPPRHGGILVQPGATRRPQRAGILAAAAPSALIARQRDLADVDRAAACGTPPKAVTPPTQKRTFESSLRPHPLGSAIGRKAGIDGPWLAREPISAGCSLRSASHAGKDRFKGSSNDAKAL